MITCCNSLISLFNFLFSSSSIQFFLFKTSNCSNVNGAASISLTHSDIFFPFLPVPRKMLTYSYSLSASWTFNTFFPFIPVYLISFQIIIVKLQYCSTVIACYSVLLAILNYFHHLFHLKTLISSGNFCFEPLPDDIYSCTMCTRPEASTIKIWASICAVKWRFVQKFSQFAFIHTSYSVYIFHFDSPFQNSNYPLQILNASSILFIGCNTPQI